MLLASPRPAAADSRSARRGSDGVLVALVGVGLLAFYVAIQRGTMVSWDGRIMASVAKDLWQHGRLQLSDSFGTPTRPGDWSKYGIGTSLLMAPLWALQPNAGVMGSVWITLVNPVVLAITGAIVCRIGIELGWRRTTAVTAAVAFGLLTMAVQYSTEILSEPSVVLGTVLAVLGLLRWENRHATGPWLMGIGIGWAITCRSDSVFAVAPILLAIPLFVPTRRLVSQWRQWIPGIAIPLAAAGLGLAYYNNLRCGSPMCNSYAGEGFTFPMPSGLFRILLSPGKGFFWYNLILLMALPGIVLFWRRHRALAVTISVLTILRVLIFSKWHAPDGSVAWGPRFLLPMCALLVLPSAEVWQQLMDRSGTMKKVGVTVVSILAAASAVVSVASVWVGYDQVWAETGDPRGLQPSQYATVQAHRVNNYYNSIRGSNIVRDLSLMSRAKPFPLLHFHGGLTLFGGGALLLSFAALLAAGLTARRREQTSLTGPSRGSGREPAPVRPMLIAAAPYRGYDDVLG